MTDRDDSRDEALHEVLQLITDANALLLRLATQASPETLRRSVEIVGVRR